MQSFTFLIHNIYYIGGTTRAIINLANTLSKRGHNVTLLSVFKSKTLPAYPIHENINVESIIDYSNKLNIVPMVMNRIHKYTPFLKPKLIHPDEPGLNQFSSYIERKIIKAIEHVNTDFLVGTRATYNILIAQYSHTTTIGMEHMHFNAHSKRLQSLIKFQYSNLNYITTLTDEDCNIYSLFHPNVFTLPNIIPETTNNRNEQNIISSLGRLEYEKGFDLLIDSVYQIAPSLRHLMFKVNIYGEGKEYSHLLQMIDQYQIDDIISIHPMTQDVASIYNTSMIVAVPSRSEGFGMVLLEAMQAGCNVVSFNAPIGPKTLLNECNAIVVDCFKTQEFGDAILSLIQDKQLRQQLKQGGYETILQFSEDEIYKIIKNKLF
ncbi:glycosyltransferase [Macrococcoides canis]|uniref:glycosyltransferase n=1 Tax=Macrococcoides canis TaxID=1855823 RepID=UPI0010FC02FC|nr:glycosyltransferase [Macrococcus canis]QCT74479.1 glycosyltransferase family 4 protein [Macrococcus canis]QNR07484.1 glycosyltransferase [Macrococcus canis]